MSISILENLPLPALITRLSDQRLLAVNAAGSEQNLSQALHQLPLHPFQNVELSYDSRWWLAASQPTNFEGEAALLITFQDITAYKRQLEQYQALTGFISDYTYTYRVEPDQSLVRESVSSAFWETTGYSSDAIDTFNQLTEFIHPDDLDIARQQLQILLEGHRNMTEFRFINPAGEIGWLRNYVQPVMNDERVVRFYGMAQNITYRKRAEEALLYGTAQDIAFRKQAEAQLRSYASELEAVNHELDAYSHTIAHDLKAPLSGIVGLIDLIEYALEIAPQKVPGYLHKINDAAQHMSKMISQLLMMARLRNAEQTVVLVDVSAAIAMALKRFQEPIETGAVTIHIEEPLPMALGHSPWIEEVFANLIGNAIKYMGDDNLQPLIIIRGERTGFVARYEVIDNGVGIAEAAQSRLFEMFTRLDTVKREGTGLGLSIVHRIVTKLQGQVGVTSEPGKGSTFWLTLPAL